MRKIFLIIVMILSIPHLNAATSYQSNSDDYWLYFNSTRDQNFEIYRMDIESRQIQRLTNNVGDDFFEMWATGNEWMIYRSQRNGRFQLYRMRPDGTEQQQLTNSDSGRNSHASLSPDGSWILFHSSRDNIYGSNLYRIDLDGSDERQLTFTASNDSFQAWSPDGEWLIFHSDRYDRTTNLYRMRPDGTEQHPITVGAYSDSFSFWLPNLDRLVFVRDDGRQQDIYSVNLDGTDLRQLTSNQNSLEWRVTLSPDNQSAIYHTREARANAPVSIYRMDLDGNQTEELIDVGGENYFEAWSPDGNWMIISNRNFESTRIYRFHLIDGVLELLADEGRVSNFSAWSPDGEWIIFTSNRDGNYELYRMQSDGSNVQRLTFNDANDSFETWGPEN